MDHGWVKTKPKTPKYKALRDRESEDKLKVAEQHRRLREEFYERTGNRWLTTR
jgi:hypothetical protein